MVTTELPCNKLNLKISAQKNRTVHLLGMECEAHLPLQVLPMEPASPC